MNGLPGPKRRWRRTHDLPALDIRSLARHGLFDSPGVLQVRYTSSAYLVSASRDQLVLFDRDSLARTPHASDHWSLKLTWTPCHFGGARAWFICPTCLVRAAIVFLGPPPVCRRCAGLRYPSQSQTRLVRAVARREKLNGRLNTRGWGLVCLRPRHMHLTTYVRLLDQRRTAIDHCNALLRQRFHSINH